MTVTASDLREQARSAPSVEELKVWDPLLRLFHWSLAASFLVAWVSSEGWDLLHYWAGYAAGGLVAFRLLWGLIGPRYARFSQFLRSFLRSSSRTARIARAVAGKATPARFSQSMSASRFSAGAISPDSWQTLSA